MYRFVSEVEKAFLKYGKVFLKTVHFYFEKHSYEHLVDEHIYVTHLYMSNFNMSLTLLLASKQLKKFSKKKIVKLIFAIVIFYFFKKNPNKISSLSNDLT